MLRQSEVVTEKPPLHLPWLRIYRNPLGYCIYAAEHRVGFGYRYIAGVYYAAREIPGKREAVAVGETDFGVAMAGIPGVMVAGPVGRGVGYYIALCYAAIARNYGEWFYGYFPHLSRGIPTSVAGPILCLPAVPGGCREVGWWVVACCICGNIARCARKIGV